MGDPPLNRSASITRDTTLPAHRLNARVCIIGSGMAGSALSLALSDLGHDVVVVEAGGTERETQEKAHVSAEFVGRALNRPTSRCIELGGTTNQWHGVCATLDEIDFQTRSWIPDSGWCIDRPDLIRYYRKAAGLLNVRLADDLARAPEDHQMPHGWINQIFNCQILTPKLATFRKASQRWKSTLLARQRSGRIRLQLHSPALELIVGDDQRTITGLIAGSELGLMHVSADVFVVCAGTLETPRLLLNSRRTHAMGIGNSHDLVGRFLMDHPAGHFGKVRFNRTMSAPLLSGFDVGSGVSAMAALRLTPEAQRDHGLANHSLWLRPSISLRRIEDRMLRSFLAIRGARDLTLPQIWAMLTNPDVGYRVLMQRFSFRPRYRYGDLYFMTEQLPNRESRVSLSSRAVDPYGYPVSRVDWRVSSQDFEGFHRYIELLLNSGLRQGLVKVAQVEAPDVWPERIASAAHHLGTARMGASPNSGVVDGNLKVFGTGNLYVCDGSVFPTVGGVNPSLTITALALRLADHLNDRYRAFARR